MWPTGSEVWADRRMASSGDPRALHRPRRVGVRTGEIRAEVVQGGIRSIARGRGVSRLSVTGGRAPPTRAPEVSTGRVPMSTSSAPGLRRSPSPTTPSWQWGARRNHPQRRSRDMDVPAHTGAHGTTGVCKGAGLFVAVSRQVHVIASNDGRSWTLAAEGMRRLHAVTHGPRASRAVAGWGSSGSGAIRTSPDGLTWTLQPHPESASLATVVRSGVFYLAAGHQGTVCMSEDGVDRAVRVVESCSRGSSRAQRRTGASCPTTWPRLRHACVARPRRRGAGQKTGLRALSPADHAAA